MNKQADSKMTHIEFLRIAAAFLVIVNHTNSQIFMSRGPSPTWFCSLTYFYICKIAVPLFLFIMGALLLGKEDTPEKTRARLFRILAVFFAGSLCYYIYYAHRNGEPINLGKFLFYLPSTSSTNAFWYLYLYIALLCMLPILQRLAKALDKRQLGYLLFFSVGVSGTTPLITVFFPEFTVVNYFPTLIGTYAGQVLLGYFIERYVPMTKRAFWSAFCSFLLLIAFQVAGAYLLYRRGAYYLALDDRTFITITASATAFLYLRKISFRQAPAPRPAGGRHPPPGSPDVWHLSAGGYGYDAV